MSPRLKKYLSVCFLLLFLFPAATEVAHQFQHRNDAHCPEKNTIHFHATEHHCFICDYVPVTSDKPSIPDFVSLVVNSDSQQFSFYQAVPFEQNKFSFSLRGPPAVS